MLPHIRIMHKFVQANTNIKLDFVNRHFRYFYKFYLLTNGWGIPLGIQFFYWSFYESIDKEKIAPHEKQKYFYDNASLKTVIVPYCYLQTY